MTLSTSALAQICQYGIYSKTEAVLKDRVLLNQGTVGAAQMVETGHDSIINGNLVSGGNMLLKDRTLVNGDILAAGSINIMNQVVVNGSQTPFATVAVEAIAQKTVSPGTQNINLYNGQSQTLVPGAYGDLRMYDGSTLYLQSGEYSFNRFIVEAGSATLNMNPANGVIDINVETELRFSDRNQFVLPQEASPEQVRFYTNSSNQIKIGTDSVFKGVVTAPNATIFAHSRTLIQGALYGQTVWIDNDVDLELITTCSFTVDFKDPFVFDPGQVPGTTSGTTIVMEPLCEPGETLIPNPAADQDEILECQAAFEDCITWSDDDVEDCLADATCTTWVAHGTVENTSVNACDLEYCTPEGDELENELAATTPGCAPVVSFFEDECPEIELEDGTIIPGTCTNMPGIEAITTPDQECLDNGGSPHLCLLAAQDCVTTTYCSDDSIKGDDSFQRSDPDFDDWTTAPVDVPHVDTSKQVPVLPGLSIDPCKFPNWGTYSSGNPSPQFPTALLGFDNSDDNSFAPNAGSGQVENSNRWSWKKGSNRWNVYAEAGYTANAAYVKGLFTSGAEVGAGYQADAMASATVFGNEFEIAQFYLANKIETCDWHSAASLKLFGDLNDYFNEVTITNQRTHVSGGMYIQAGGNIASADPQKVQECKNSLDNFYDKTRQLLWNLTNAQVFDDVWQALGGLPHNFDGQQIALTFENALNEYNSFVNYYNTQFIPAMNDLNAARQAAVDHTFEANLLDAELWVRSPNVIDPISIGPFSINVAAGVSGRVGTDLVYKNEMEFNTETNFGYLIPSFTEGVNANPYIKVGGFAVAAAGFDAGLFGGEAGVEGHLNLLDFEFPTNASYTFNPVHSTTTSPLAQLYTPGFVDWNLDYEADSKMQLHMLSGELDLFVRGFIRLWRPFKKIKLSKTWRKNLTKWAGIEVEDARKSLYNTEGTITLATTPDLFALPQQIPQIDLGGIRNGIFSMLGENQPDVLAPGSLGNYTSPFYYQEVYERMVRNIYNGKNWFNLPSDYPGDEQVCVPPIIIE